uniref:Uncharacterized protein n=1 Tax=Megaselia scalaris TaxID=36166 RepID=T1GRT2_MEGSC
MCRKCFRVPTLLVVGVLITIVLVVLTGITLTNKLNVHNIIKLNEKVVSDSVSNSQESKETRDIYMSRHPKNLNKSVIIRLEVDNTSAKYDRLIANDAEGVDIDMLTTVSYDNNFSRTDSSDLVSNSGKTMTTTTTTMMTPISTTESAGKNVSNDNVDNQSQEQSRLLSIMEKNYTLIDFEKREHIKQLNY